MKRILAKTTALLSAISIGTFGFSPVVTQASTPKMNVNDYYVKSLYICGDSKWFPNYAMAKEYCKTRGVGFGVLKDDPAKGDVLYIHGDINDDKKISPIDITLLKRCLGSGLELTPDQQERADIDNNGVINMWDLTKLQQYYNSIAIM